MTSLSRSLIGVVVCSFAVTASAETLSSLVDRYAQPTLDKNAVAVSNVAFQELHFKVTLRGEFPVMRHDVNKATHWKAR